MAFESSRTCRSYCSVTAVLASPPFMVKRVEEVEKGKRMRTQECPTSRKHRTKPNYICSSASASSGCPLLLGLPRCTGIGVDTSAAGGAGGLRQNPRCSLLATHCLPINSGEHSASSASASSGCPLLLGLPRCTGIGVDTSAAGGAGGLRRNPRCSLLATHCLPINSGDGIRLEPFDIVSR